VFFEVAASWMLFFGVLWAILDIVDISHLWFLGGFGRNFCSISLKKVQKVVLFWV